MLPVLAKDKHAFNIVPFLHSAQASRAAHDDKPNRQTIGKVSTLSEARARSYETSALDSESNYTMRDRRIFMLANQLNRHVRASACLYQDVITLFARVRLVSSDRSESAGMHECCNPVPPPHAYRNCV